MKHTMIGSGEQLAVLRLLQTEHVPSLQAFAGLPPELTGIVGDEHATHLPVISNSNIKAVWILAINKEAGNYPMRKTAIGRRVVRKTIVAGKHSPHVRCDQ